MIKYTNIKKSFSGRTVLNDISFSVAEGEIVFILGTSGTGKSVLLKNTVGLMKPDSGEILFQGTDIVQLNEEQLLEIRKQCGMIFQHPALFDSLTVRENLAFGLKRLKKLNDDDIEQLIKQSLEDVNLSLDILEKKPSEISYGMQKRVSIARTLAIHPQVLLFDEPTTGLDPVTTTAINQLIYTLSRKHKITSIVVSHDMGCAIDIADKIIVLDKGNIIEQGSVTEVQKSQVPLVKDFMLEVSNDIS
ncbi:MAG: ATP-binding cassette domain-containing protein [Bdellovibrionales bacterium]|nr:ATP-binding cassette domain-containing protein [Bdellovibrionales bacterium]